MLLEVGQGPVLIVIVINSFPYREKINPSLILLTIKKEFFCYGPKYDLFFLLSHTQKHDVC